MSGAGGELHGAIDLSTLLPLVRGTVIPDGPASAVLPEMDTPLAGPLVGNLVVAYAFDSPQFFVSATRRHLATLGVTLEEARVSAYTNLVKRAAGVQCHGTGSSYMLTVGDDLESSLMLLPEIWRQLSSMVEGDVVVAVPARDVILVSGSESPSGLALMDTAAERTAQRGDHLVSPLRFRWTKNETWALFEPHRPPAP